MSDILGIFGAMIKRANQTTATPKQTVSEWQKCVWLQESGWSMVECQRVSGQGFDDLVLKWGKDGQEQVVRLSYTDQRLWLNWLGGGKGSSKKIV